MSKDFTGPWIHERTREHFAPRIQDRRFWKVMGLIVGASFLIQFGVVYEEGKLTHDAQAAGAATVEVSPGACADLLQVIPEPLDPSYIQTIVSEGQYAPDVASVSINFDDGTYDSAAAGEFSYGSFTAQHHLLTPGDYKVVARLVLKNGSAVVTCPQEVSLAAVTN